MTPDSAPSPTASPVPAPRRLRRPLRLALTLLAASLTGQAAYEPTTSSGSQLPAWDRVPGTVQDFIAIFGAGLFLLVVLLVWARYFRKRPRDGSSHERHHHRHREERTSEADGGDDESGPRRHRRKRRRREHRTRNPTLAETGGLPPPRTQDQSQP